MKNYRHGKIYLPSWLLLLRLEDKLVKSEGHDYVDRGQHAYECGVREAGRSASPMTSNGTARALGWFSVGLGLAKLLAPRLFRKVNGMTGEEPLLCGIGLREIATGIGVLASQRSTGHLAKWMRACAGRDAVDFARLAAALLSRGGPRRARRRWRRAAEPEDSPGPRIPEHQWTHFREEVRQ